MPHTAKELRDGEYETFKQLGDAVMRDGKESISMPSNLVLMYQAVT